MLIDLSLLMDYTDWERQQWYDWLRHQDEQVLEISVGPHGYGRFQTLRADEARLFCRKALR